MIALGTDGATAIVSLMVVIAIGWAVFLSIGSAARDATWARRQIRIGSFGVVGLGAVGALALIWVEPVWVGVAGLYIAAIVWVMSRSVRASLRRAEVFGGAAISDERRRELLGGTARWMALAAAAMVLVTIADWSWRGPVAAADAVLALVFGAGAVAARRLTG